MTDRPELRKCARRHTFSGDTADHARLALAVHLPAEGAVRDRRTEFLIRLAERRREREREGAGR